MKSYHLYDKHTYANTLTVLIQHSQHSYATAAAGSHKHTHAHTHMCICTNTHELRHDTCVRTLTTRQQFSTNHSSANVNRNHLPHDLCTLRTSSQLDTLPYHKNPLRTIIRVMSAGRIELLNFSPSCVESKHAIESRLVRLFHIHFHFHFFLFIYIINVYLCHICSTISVYFSAILDFHFQ